MYDYYFTFRSVTAAMQGGRALERAGITSYTHRTPKYLRQQGCGYSLRVRGEALAAAKLALEREGIAHNKIYRREGETQWQEVAP